MNYTIMITTRDRCCDLEHTCSKLRALQPAADEVIICADGCRDGTVAMLEARFPEFRLLENPSAIGSVNSRDRMLRSARGDVVLSLDDDSHPTQIDFLIRVRRAFEEHPEAAVIAFAELSDAPKPSGARGGRVQSGRYVPAYANCAAAMRKSFYLEQSGFPYFFGHMHEEPDYALQCYTAGAAVWFEPTIIVRHEESAVNRHPIGRHHLNARNELWSVWLRCPWPWVPVVSMCRVARQFVYACSEGLRWVLCEPCWWWAAVRGLGRCCGHRQAVPWHVYRRWLGLARNPIRLPAQLRTGFGWEEEPASPLTGFRDEPRAAQ